MKFDNTDTQKFNQAVDDQRNKEINDYFRRKRYWTEQQEKEEERQREEDIEEIRE